MRSGSHVVVLHRWRDRYADYARYLDHTEHTVTYISTEVGTESVPSTAREVVVVPAIDDLPVVAAEVRTLARRFGPPDHIVALKEDDLIVAAQLRAQWGCPGPTVAETMPFRDKVTMSTLVAASGIDVPAFAEIGDGSDVERFAVAHGWPVVVKPRAGSSSAGVVVATRRDEIPAHVSGAMVQAFSSGEIHHIDGVFDGSEVVVHTISRYLRTCLEFRAGVPIGSVEVDDAATHRRAGLFAQRALRALTTRPTVFHLEAFLDNNVFRFLEVGARAGGAEIPFVWRDLHNYDLNGAAFRIALGAQPPAVGAVDTGGPVGGFLLVAAPAERPCRIDRSTPMLGAVPELYAEVVLQPGQILPAADAYYEHVGGRFRFRGSSTAAVAAAVTRVGAEYQITGTALDQPNRTPAPTRA
ncbi:acetyl-CoA carboxylase biotin carboxylase subunit family protein [Nocardia sp. NPDC058519]|uniref:ATP-grasp domain-containing protein n=1 Tax=Nocardia sp. NPDC058519 TaxID=3346535 RepID=UPI0036651B88